MARAFQLARAFGARQVAVGPHRRGANALVILRASALAARTTASSVGAGVEHAAPRARAPARPRSTPDHRRLAHARQRVEHALDVFRKDVEPFRRDDHFLLAALDEERGPARRARRCRRCAASRRRPARPRRRRSSRWSRSRRARGSPEQLVVPPRFGWSSSTGTPSGSPRPWPARSVTSSASPAGWPRASLKALNASRSSIRTANGPRFASADRRSPSSRWNAPWLRKPVRASCSARTRTSPWASAFWSAIDAWPANSLVSSNSFGLKCASASPIRPMLSVPIDLAVDQQRDDDHRLGLERRARAPGPSADRGGRGSRGRPRRGRHPAGDPGAERALVGEDEVREAVAGDDRAADAATRSTR